LEEILGAAIARVPAEEAEAPCCHQGRDVVLGEVHIVVRGNDRGLWPLRRRRPVDSLAGMSAGACPRRGGGRKPDEAKTGAVHDLSFFSMWSARHTFSGVAGISKRFTPRASVMALMTAAGAAIAPASPQPFTPIGFDGHFVIVMPIPKSGM